MSDITIQFGYVKIDGEQEMAMGVRRAALGRTPIFAIPLSSAWMYNEPRYMAQAVHKIANHLGMFPDAFLLKRIANLILNWLPELIASAPYEEQEGQEIGEGKLTINDKVTHFAMTDTGFFLH